MAINKRKILQSAQKHLQKGTLDKALEDYQTLLKADPRDTNIRLKAGDLYLKMGKTEDAITSYLKVAERFMQEGFDAKAVALYKQITKLDPKRVDVCVPLAEVYQRMGLTQDAMKALQTAADAAYKAGDKIEALSLLRKMAALDPGNTTNRLKVADLLHQEGQGEEAVAEYQAVAEELERQGDAEERLRVLGRILEIEPARLDTLLAVSRSAVAQRSFEQAEQAARSLVEHHPEELEGRELLGKALEGLGERDEAGRVFRSLAELWRQRGDEDKARDLVQRYGADTELSVGDSEPPVLETDDALETDEELTAHDDFELDSGLPEGDLAEVSAEFTDPGFAPDGLRIGERIESVTEETADEEEEPGDSDAEQLLAEASVYLRYGKHDRAVESLRAVLSNDPGHLRALEKLGEALVFSGDVENAATAWRRTMVRARELGDEEVASRAMEQLAELDPTAADDTPMPVEVRRTTAAAPAAPEPEETLESVDDFEIDVGDDVEEPAAASAAAAPAPPADIEIDFDTAPPVEEPEAEPASDVEVLQRSDDFDIEVEVGGDEAPVTPESAAPEPTAPEPTAPDLGLAAADDEIEIDLDAGDVDPPGDATDRLASGDEEPAEAAEQGEESTSSATTPAQIVEELEEAEFYFSQGMMDEARAIYERVIKLAPGHAKAQLRLGEIEAQAASAPAAGEESEEPRVVEEQHTPAEPDIGDFDFGDDEPSASEEHDEPLAAAPPDEAVEPPPAAAPEAEVTAPESPAEPGDWDPSSLAEPEDLPEELDLGDDVGDFDLAAELTDAMETSGSGTSGQGLAGTTEEEGFEQVFAAFKQGVRSELGEGDQQAHYDLGIAYKEMGLLDDAIGEFRIAMEAPAHQLSSLHMMGLCALDLGRAADATAHLEQALSVADVPEEQRMALRFDLGRAYALAGDVSRARECFEAVRALDPEFCDVGSHLAALDGGPAVAPAGEAFESFDDLIAADDEPPRDAAYESFDDLIEEAEPEPDTAEPIEGELEAEPVAEPAPEPEPEPVSQTRPEPEPASAPPRPRRKKKISFV